MIAIVKIVLTSFFKENNTTIIISMILLFALSLAIGFSTAEIDSNEILFDENFSKTIN